MGKDEIVCYCFAFSKKDIVEDARKNGDAGIYEYLMMRSMRGECRCEEKHPDKGPCLKEVRRLIDNVLQDR